MYTVLLYKKTRAKMLTVIKIVNFVLSNALILGKPHNENIIMHVHDGPFVWVH